MTRDIWDQCQVPNKNIVFKEFRGLWGWVLDNKAPLLTNDPESDPRSCGTPWGHIQIERFISVPALREGELKGLIAAANSAREYTGDDLFVVRKLASIYSLAVERWLSEQSRLESESRFRQLFSRMLDGFAYHRIVVDDEGRPVDYVFLEVNEAFERLTGLRSEDVVGEHGTEVFPGVDDEHSGLIARYGKVALQGEDTRFEQYLPQLDRWFAVSAYCPGPGFFCTVFEDITERKRLSDELWVMASTDALTGCDSRRRILDRLDEELHRASRYQHPLSILLIDVDALKAINDMHGHAMGDAALQRVVSMSTNELRRSDSIGRLGGDEFLIVLPETSQTRADEVAQRLCHAIGLIRIQSQKGELPVAVSIGGAWWRPGEALRDVDQILKEADEALYAAKQQGRHGVMMRES
jgi:diguanylate cyclase (GGDEF)-like protein/PAS domain S-box-containing protein